jgi:cation diffusion facilitator CzcD-associated flavoprotein CzcO
MSEATAEYVDVLIVGAGVSGVGAAHHLQQRAPGKSYMILEARDGMGGTWDLFRYPGIRSDSDMHTFGYAFKPWEDGKVFADGPAIRNYVKETADESGITPNIRFKHRVLSSNWNSRTARWEVEAKRTDTGERVRVECRFLMMCSGYYRYDHGHVVHWEGEKDFAGDIIHPQHWREDYDYSGKKVVIIGSGATAVTLVPAMAEKAGHVTMLQRSPTYIAPRPSVDPVANFLRKILPRKAAYSATRIKNVLISIIFFEIAQRWPGWVKNQVHKYIRDELGEDYDIDKHFTPKYNPWDERFCAAPDGDFFQSLKKGEASVVTDHIERFTKTGIQLKSGEHLEADLIIPATGLEMLLAGGMAMQVDGREISPPETVSYRGMMLSQLPNLALAFGYTNASWTLKIDLTCERVCRLLNHMDAKGYDYCVPEPPAGIETQPLLNLQSGYIKRAEPHLPRQGTEPPWRTYQNYIQDMLAIRYGKLEDGALQFYRKSDEGASAPRELAAAE